MSFTQEQYNAHFQTVRNVFVRVDLLNEQENVVDRLEGIATQGSISADSESPIRRTANVTFILYDDLLPSQESKLWITNRIQLYIGLRDYMDDVHWFNLGIYIINDPSVDVSVAQRTISVNLVDKMYLLETKPLELITRIDSGTNISTAMKNVVQTLGGETKFLIDNHQYTVPFDLELNPTQTVLDYVIELRDLYRSYEAFYDVDGRFIFRQTPNRLNDPIVWSFTEDADFRIDSSLNINYSNIKNYIKVIGRTLDNGVTISTIEENNDVNSPLSIAKIGKRALVEENSNYFEVEQATQLAEYLLFKHGNFNEQVNISCVPIYFLRPNNLIEFNSPEDGLVGKYSITSISLPLDFQSPMSVTAYKIYE